MQWIKHIIRVGVLLLIVLMGLTAVAPQWLDLFGGMRADYTKQKKREKEHEEYVHFQKYPIPDNWKLKVIGAISNHPLDLEIIYNVAYKARKDEPECRSWSLMSGAGPDFKFYEYKAQIKGGRYQVEIPLDKHPAYQGCHFQVTTIKMGISVVGSKPSNSNTLFADRDHMRELSVAGYPTRSVNNELLSLDCYQPIVSDKVFPNHWDCGHAGMLEKWPTQELQNYMHTEELKWQVDINLIPSLVSSNKQRETKKVHQARNQLGMLLRLFGDYLMVINQPTRQSTASELLNVIQDKVDMAPYQESSLYKKYQNSLSKVKNQIEQTNGVPTDPWGTPYNAH